MHFETDDQMRASTPIYEIKVCRTQQCSTMWALKMLGDQYESESPCTTFEYPTIILSGPTERELQT
jgi:hypothetical protein